MEAVFVSDIHLGNPEDRRYQSFLAMLDRLIIRPPKRLVLLGDIFDLWVAKHSYFLNKHKSLLNKLSDLKAKGCEIHYFEGNHDLYLKDYFGKKLGFQIHPNSFTDTWAGIKVRMEHGDLANPNDTGYLFLRKFLRNPLVRFVLSNIPSSWVKKIGEKASEASRKYTDTFDDDSKMLIRAYVEKLSIKNQFQVMITGHTHQKDDHFFFLPNEEKRRSINLGSWFGEAYQALVLDEKAEFTFTDIENI